MIILQGPDDQLRGWICQQLKATHNLEIQKMDEDDHRADINYLTMMATTDHRRVVQDQFLHELPDDSPERFMLGMALAAAGSIAVTCGVQTPMGMRYASMDGLLHVVVADSFTSFNLMMDAIVKEWKSRMEAVDPVFNYMASGDASPDFPQTMIVGEATIVERGRPVRAFIKPTGCSLFLHQVLMQNKDRTRYYLTNAQKGDDREENILALAREIEHVKPGRIVTMGDVADRYLKDMGVKHDRTQHPSYWQRYKYHQRDELVKFLQ